MNRLFGTSGIRGNLDKVSPELAMNLGLSLATLLGNKGTVAIGHDVRLSSPLLGRSLSSGLMSGGCNVDQLGYVPTPILAFTTRNRKLEAGVMITGSHNPPSDNGLKCYTGEGREYTSDEEAPLEDHILKESYRRVSWDRIGTQSSPEGVLDEYCEAILDSVERCQRKIHIVVDCANSVASKVTPRLLSQLGCKVTTLNANIDGTFASRSPEPTPETLITTSKIAVAAGADLTVAHDADADRISILDENGQYVANDRVLAFFAKMVLARHGPGAIATTVDTSFRIDEVAKRYGGEVRRTKLGKTQEFIKSHERNLLLCCEPYKIIDVSWGSWGDGIYAACKLASSLANSDVSLSQLLSDIPDYPQARVSYCCPNDIKEQAMKTVETVLLEEQEKQDVWTYDGVRVNYPDESWALVRASGTEPKIRLYCEAKSHKRLDQLLKKTSTLVHESIERRH